nr:uncharacterized protein LOC112022158 [Quercus suber]
MVEDVVERMTSLKLTSKEEEDIQVSDEGRLDELEGCALSLIGKFLTCKPFNRKAAKNTLRQAWGLDKDLQISEVGINLFQFKFQSEYELDRILRGGLWTFDNQLLMLTRWRSGMSANNVVLEHASLWVQIWGVPFDMMSPKVATEVGNKMGVVEDVGRRRRTDDQSFFLRVRVALPIAKPIRRGGFLLGSDSKRHWVTYKYERLPLFCHYCGILGHDIRHCPAHFTASKAAATVEYQYGDWLKAENGRSKSPPRRSKENPMRSEPVGHTDTVATANDEGIEEEKISEVNAAHNSNVNDLLPIFSPSGDVHQILNDESNGVTNTSNSSLGQVELKPNRPKATWTRLNKMDVGPIESTNFKMKPITGKRGMEEAMNPDSNRDAETLFHKRSKVDKEDGIAANTSARVDDHPCREQ